MFSLANTPCWYIALAVLVSAYQAYRGFMLQWLLGVGNNWSNTRKVLLLCLADMLTYFLCTLSGFYSIFTFYWISTNHTEATKDLEHPTLLIFFALYGLLGITGKLPDLLNKLKLPKSE